MNIWASIILWEDADPARDRIVRESKTEKLTIVFVPDAAAAVREAEALVRDGVELIELCGGFGLIAGAQVAEAMQGRAAVGAVTFGIESLAEAARYKAKFESAAGQLR